MSTNTLCSSLTIIWSSNLIRIYQTDHFIFQVQSCDWNQDMVINNGINRYDQEWQLPKAPTTLFNNKRQKKKKYIKKGGGWGHCLTIKSRRRRGERKKKGGGGGEQNKSYGFHLFRKTVSTHIYTEVIKNAMKVIVWMHTHLTIITVWTESDQNWGSTVCF